MKTSAKPRAKAPSAAQHPENEAPGAPRVHPVDPKRIAYAEPSPELVGTRLEPTRDFAGHPDAKTESAAFDEFGTEPVNAGAYELS